MSLNKFMPHLPPFLRNRWPAAVSLLALATCLGAGGAAAAPTRVDLTTLAWFPPIVTQQGNSCAQHAGLYYLLTAERNRRHFLTSWQPANRFSPYQTYAILADSPSGSTHVTDGWHLARETGVPMETDWPRGSHGLMHGFEKYVRAARIRPTSWQLLPIRTETDVGRIKKQLAAGHPLACDFQMRGARLVKQKDGSSLVTGWGRTGPGHTMIYAGYDENIGYDVNGDGMITNDRDITGDGKVTLADHERGAFLVINPWGRSWGSGGKAWALMREHALTPWPRAGEVARLTQFKESPPRLMLRISLALADRSALKLSVSDGRRSVTPMPFSPRPLPHSTRNPVSAWEVFGKVHRPGPLLSPAPLANPAGGPLEMGFDLSALAGGRTFTVSLTNWNKPLQGTLHAAVVVELDARGQIIREMPVPGLPAVLPPQGASWTTSR